MHTHHVKRDKKKINLHVLNTDSNLNSLKDGLQPAKGKQLRFGVQQAIVQALFLDYKNMQNKGGKKKQNPSSLIPSFKKRKSTNKSTSLREK